jgi:DNA repair protein RadC
MKKISITSLPPHELPREKLIANGAENLKTSELLALLLGSGTKEANVLEIAKRLFKKFGTEEFSKITFNQLKTEKGIGKAKACVILACLELGKRFFTREEHFQPVISGPEAAYLQLKHLAQHKKEYFMALYLNAKNQILKQEIISIGSLFSNMVHPREVFAPALEVRAAAVVLGHNHPSGDPTPSPEDQSLTQRLTAAGDLMGIEVLDHLVIGTNRYVSLKETGLILPKD